MARIRLIHWNREEARRRLAVLRKLGHTVTWAMIADQKSLPALRRPRPDLYLIDLTRMPGNGRDVALWLRKTKSTRSVPILFAGGEPDKITRVRASLPDAAYAPWTRIRGAISKALSSPPASPWVPASTLAGYSGTPLPRKLGVKPGMTVALRGAPRGFEQTLGPLPEGVKCRRRSVGSPELIIWFVKSAAVLGKDVRRVGRLFAEGGGLWIAWPKKASGVSTDVTGDEVRRTGLASGLVDYKICAIDATWSGLKFARRKPKR